VLFVPRISRYLSPKSLLATVLAVTSIGVAATVSAGIALGIESAPIDVDSSAPVRGADVYAERSVLTPPLRPTRALRAASREVGALEGSGDLRTVPGSSELVGHGPVHRFTVEVEEGVPVDPAAFAAEVERTLFDARGWTRGGGTALRRVDSGKTSFSVVVASPDTTDRLCAPLATNGRFSCYRGGRAVLNVWRWVEGASEYGDDLRGYRRYLVNHEVGHALGHAEHRSCPGAGERAPVMMQQTRGAAPCEPVPWPLASERATVAP